MSPNRIIIIGDAGRGKSALAAKLTAKLKIENYCTDDFYYELKYSKPRDRDEALRQIAKVYEGASWIVEGTTQWLLSPGLDSADLIIYLKYKNIFIQWFVIIMRYFRQGCRNTKNTLILLRHVFYKRYGLGYKKGKLTHEQIIAPYASKTIILSSFEEINNFLKNGIAN